MSMQTTYLDLSYSEKKSRLAVVCSIDALDEKDGDDLVSSIANYSPDDDDWGSLEVEGILARSVAYLADGAWIVGKYGEAWHLAGENVSEETLPDSGVSGKRHLGPPKLIREIGGEALVVCGYAGQVYTRVKKKWVHMDDGLVEPEGKVDSIQLEGLHGTSPGDIYVSGSGGLLAHWNGKAWKKIPILTDKWLAGVRCISKDDVIAVGNEGVVVRGDGKRWKVEQIPGYEETNLADVEVFGGRLYVAAQGHLLASSGDGWELVKHGLGKKAEFFRLTTGGGRLWCMGGKRISSFDGKKWRSHVDPDNG